MIISEPGIYPGISNKAYHADPAAIPSLNSSIAKILCSRSPAHAFQAHPRLGGEVVEEDGDGDGEEKVEKVSSVQLLGSLVHRLMLGAGGEIVVCPFDSWRKGDAKAQRAAVLEAGGIPTLPPMYERAKKIVKAGRAQLDAMGLSHVGRDGDKEVMLLWKDGNAMLRALLDQMVVNPRTGILEIWDLKTVTRSSHPDACATQIINMGYDFSSVFYKQGVFTLKPEWSGRAKFYWAFQETAPPYAITPVDIDGEWQGAALQHYCNAIDAWQKCTAANRWPYYTDKIVTLEAKPWMLAAAMGAEVAGNL